MKQSTARTILIAFALFSSATFLSSCASFSPSTYGISDVIVEQKQNGYLIELPAQRPVKDVTAFISKDNWLVITLVGATVDFDRLRTRQPDELIAEVQVVGYATSVQLTLKLKKDFRSCDVIHPPGSDDIGISLFE
jgi:AMIN domain